MIIIYDFEFIFQEASASISGAGVFGGMKVRGGINVCLGFWKLSKS